MLEQWLVVVAVLLVLSVFGSKASGRLGVPALLFFLALGLLAGPEGILGIAWRDLAVIQAVGVIALIYILFSGGLDTSWSHIRPVLWSGILLSTVGVLLTALLMAVFAVLALGFTLLEGLLLGAVISSTDAAAVFAILRSKEVRLRGNLEPLLELESGSNDPVAVFLTLSALRLLHRPEAGLLDLVPFFVTQFLVGGALGVVGGYGAIYLVNHARLRFDGLYSVLTVAVPLFIFGLTALLGGNGFLAVYLAGLMMNRRDFIHKNSL
ncbi:MAG: cation:proton antiporter, partial [Anaerolineae bacterium]|nr:cation:proton antiporter [Anaerolineae bacterium]